MTLQMINIIDEKQKELAISDHMPLKSMKYSPLPHLVE